MDIPVSISKCWTVIKAFAHTDIAPLLLTLSLILLYILSRRRAAAVRVYGKSHAVLNYPHDTLWQNMGYWADGDTTFVQACEALTKHVADSIGLGPSDRLLDFGYGCGEEIKYLQDNYLPKSINGCTNDPRQGQCARYLCARNRSIFLETEDAIRWCECYQQKLGGRRMPCFDCVILIDCAYHFQTRSTFLDLVSRVCMDSGSRIALADILLTDDFHKASWWRRTLFLRVLMPLMRVPRANLKTQAEYFADLQQVGFIGIQFDIITEHVFLPLSHNIQTRSQIYRDKRWIPFLIFSHLMRFWIDAKLLDFVVVTARLA